ncbi:RNA polymerase sigma factor [Segetibacter koreensis]|uniref:RNA polymerase sigma factor n=1 Tax=Segetibacter koreensis TaxID=398037 RepID=UPI00035CBE5A|nr:sigma-70 family RNA polymerase sigma factor [Segetibacter koreensis]
MNHHLNLSEKSLIDNCINGNRKSQKELYDRLSPKMFALCLHSAKNQTDAEDILQNGFVKLFVNLHRFKGDKSFEEWAREIFINTASGYIKRNKVKITIDEDLKNMMTYEHVVKLDELYEIIYTKTATKIRKPDTSVFKLYAVDGCLIEETTDNLQTNGGVLKKQRYSPKQLIGLEKDITSKKQTANLKYTIQKGDDKRLNKDGVLRVYNLSEPLDIPVRKVLGKWKKEQIGVTLVFVSGKWQIEGEIVEHMINNLDSESGFKRLLKFV